MFHITRLRINVVSCCIDIRHQNDGHLKSRPLFLVTFWSYHRGRHHVDHIRMIYQLELDTMIIMKHDG